MILVLFGCSTNTSVINKNQYLTTDITDSLKVVISDFPVKDSSLQLSDESTLRQYQKSRTKEDCHRASTEVEVTLQSFYGQPYGILNADQIKILQPLYDQIRLEGGPYIGRTKKMFKRQRPYDYLKGLQPCIAKEPSLAYPSGHATLAALYGMVLIDLMPQNKTTILARSEQLGLDRILAGVHHPTDVIAGKKMGLAIYEQIKKSPSYLEDIEKYKKQLEKTLTH